MFLFNWTAKLRLKPEFKIYRTEPFWCIEVLWLWSQSCLYNTAMAKVLTRTLNHNIDTDRTILDAEIDKIIQETTQCEQ